MDYRVLRFPLNVYASALELHYGRAEFNCYGRAETEAVTERLDLPEAQRHVAGRVIAALPPAPARVLEFGSGLGGLAGMMVEAGYEVVSVVPGPEERELACHMTEGKAQARRLSIVCDGDSIAGRFDAVVLLGTAQYMSPLALFRRAGRSLDALGRLLISDEFLDGEGDRVWQAIRSLERFLALARRTGWEIRQCVDQGPGAESSLATMLRLLKDHDARLCQTSGVDAECISRLRQAVDRDCRRFARGQRRHMLLDLRPAAPARGERNTAVEFGDIDTVTAQEAGQLFERSFGEAFNADLWQWKYADGRGRAVGARENGSLVGHYGGTTRPILYFTEPRRAIQICDVMVLPEKRQFYSRRGLFFKTAASFLELHIGYSEEHLLGFGFPNRGVMRVARRLGLYDKTDDFVELRFTRSLHPTDNDWRVEPFPREELRDMEGLALLWEKMQEDFRHSIIGVRDADYLVYRYACHPTVGYQALRIVDGKGALRAVAFTRPHEGQALLMDLIAPVARMPAALTALAGYLDARGLSLKCWITGGHADRLQLPGCQLRELGIEIPCNAWSAGPPARELAGAWWLTAGDMDFV